jgi:pilus assembly protein CpaF
MGKKLSSFFMVKDEKAASLPEDSGYESILKEVQQYVSDNYAGELQATLEDAAAKKALFDIVLQHVAAREFLYGDYTPEDLADRLIGDMAGYAFLEPLLYDDRVEEIRGNSWDDIEVVYVGKKAVKYPEHFRNPQHAIDTIKKMVRLGGYQLDESTPDVDSYFMRGVRISAWIYPVVDSDAGVAFVIRRQRAVRITEKELLEEKTATREELEFLQHCLGCGVSVVISGETGSGKTTLLEYLLSQLTSKKRILSMEENRELNLVERDAGGKAVSSVIHTRTRESSNRQYTISQNHLLRRFLRFTPDVIVVAEMRGEEAYTALSSALSGHAVATSIHAGSAQKTYSKMLMYCRESEYARAFTDDLLRQMICEAFPVVCYTKQLEDESRKIMSVAEVEWTGTEIAFRVLFEYDRIKDCHKKVSRPSEHLERMILENGGVKEWLR